MVIIKRDGSKEEFSMKKPLAAFDKVYKNGLKKEPPQELRNELEEGLSSALQTSEEVNIEAIQDYIRDFLMEHGQKDAAEAFIIYRNDRTEYREDNTKLAKNIKTKLYAKNVINQNANLDESSFSGRIGEAASEVCKDYALRHNMSKMARKNHENNEIYQHDLNSFAVGMHNCLTHPIDDALENGITLRQCDIREAGSVSTAFQLLAVNFQVQSLQQFGGVSVSHLDISMVPYVRKSFFKHYKNGLSYIKKPWYKTWKTPNIDSIDKIYTSIDAPIYHQRPDVYNYAMNLTKNEIIQAIEGFVHNMNSLQSRSGAQLPFSSVNYGTGTSIEARLVTKAMLENTIKGTGKHHRTAIFPCGIFQWDKEKNAYPGTPNYDLYKLALSSTAQRIYPNYCNNNWSTNLKGCEFDREQKYKAIIKLKEDNEVLYNKFIDFLYNNKEFQDKINIHIDHKMRVMVDSPSVMSPYEINATMGCRTYNGYDINSDSDFFYKEFEYIAKNQEFPRWGMWSANQKDGRGNLCPVTIILPTLAMEADKNVEKFIVLLDKKINEARLMLIERFTLMCAQSEKAAPYMYQNGTMYGYDGESVASALKHGTLAIGQLGLAETLQILIGCDHTTDKGMDLAKRIESLFNTKCAEFKKSDKLNFGVYYTPAESLCWTAMKKFKAKYGEIPNVSDHEYFTNSMHVPVYDDVDVFEKIDIESQLTNYSNAGCITYVELDSSVKNNINAIERIVNYAMEHDVPYFAVNVPLDYCRNCYHQGDFNGICPECGSTNIEELRRCTGYLSVDVEHMNNGKQCEVDDRNKHTSHNK